MKRCRHRNEYLHPSLMPRALHLCIDSPASQTTCARVHCVVCAPANEYRWAPTRMLSLDSWQRICSTMTRYRNWQLAPLLHPSMRSEPMRIVGSSQRLSSQSLFQYNFTLFRSDGKCEPLMRFYGKKYISSRRKSFTNRWIDLMAQELQEERQYASEAVLNRTSCAESSGDRDSRSSSVGLDALCVDTSSLHDDIASSTRSYRSPTRMYSLTNGNTALLKAVCPRVMHYKALMYQKN